MKPTNPAKHIRLPLMLINGAILTCLALCQQTSLSGASTKTAPAKSSAFGNSLIQWQDIYVRWYYGLLNIPPDANNNAVVNGVVLTPIPSTPGDGTAGHQDVTLFNGQPFFMPLLQLAGTSYTDGTPNDPLLPLSYFASYHVTLKVDGVTLINDANLSDYFTQFNFNPPIPFPFANLDSLIYLQGFGFAHSPLTPGTHTMSLDEKAGQPLPANFGGAVLEYHNTWTLNVLP